MSSIQVLGRKTDAFTCSGVAKWGGGSSPPLAALLWGRRYGLFCRL